MELSDNLESETDLNQENNQNIIEDSISDNEKVIAPVEPDGLITSFEPESRLKLKYFQSKVDAVKKEVSKMIIGQHHLVEQILLAIFSRGHVLLEGVPGIAKTMTSKVLSKTLSVDYSRIQFTPDLMPSDILGTSIFNVKTSEFTYKKGPIFSNFVLIDEINRSPAKTQAALFEVMEERQVTNDGIRYPMDMPFLIMATQNPIEQEGTYRLPEGQLDRFLFRIKLEYPSFDEEVEILKRFKNNIRDVSFSEINSILSGAEIEEFQRLIEEVKIEDQLIDYIAKLISETRNHAKLYLGASPRASLSILKSSKAAAAIRGRDFVTPDDIQYVSEPVLNHRIILTPETEMEGITTEDVIAEIIQKIEVPR